MLAHLALTFQHRAGVSPYTSTYVLAETCVFDKQSLLPSLCRPNLINAWHQLKPSNHTISDDVCNMYNETCREASFNAMRKYPCMAKLIPLTALFYSKPAAIRYDRAEGQMALPAEESDGLGDDDDLFRL